MERYVLIEKGLYQGQEARVIKEDGPWLELVVFGREQKVARSQVRFLPDNYKPFDGMFADAAEKINMQAVTKTGDKADILKGGMITADQISNGFFMNPFHNEHLGPMKGKTAKNPVNPIGVIMDNLSKAVSEVMSKARAPKDSGTLGKTPPPLNNALYSRDEIPEPITKEKIDKFLEEWPEQDFDICPSVNYSEMLKKENQEQAATIKALRLRSRSQGKTNELLSLKNDQLQKEVKEVNRDMDAVLKDNSHLKEKNDFLLTSLEAAQESADTYKKKYKSEKQAKFDYIREVEKGNQYRQGLKDSIESLHEQVRETKTSLEHEKLLTAALETDLERANKIIDKLVEPGR